MNSQRDVQTEAWQPVSIMYNKPP